MPLLQIKFLSTSCFSSARRRNLCIWRWHSILPVSIDQTPKSQYLKRALYTPCFHRLDAEVNVFREGTLYSLFLSTRRRSPCIQKGHSILSFSTGQTPKSLYLERALYFLRLSKPLFLRKIALLSTQLPNLRVYIPGQLASFAYGSISPYTSSLVTTYCLLYANFYCSLFCFLYHMLQLYRWVTAPAGREPACFSKICSKVTCDTGQCIHFFT